MRLLSLLLALLVSAPVCGQGTLVIVGGGLSPDNAEIYRAFIDGAKGGKIAIIPSASGEPRAALDAFVTNLVRHGVDRSRIFGVELAEADDPATTLDEATWAGNADAAAEIAKIQMATGIWFTGGDQARTSRLLRPNGKSTLMFTAIQRRLSSGAVVGGSSAGAAIMGSAMIACGSAYGAMEDPISFNISDCMSAATDAEPLVLAQGLGFLPRYFVDQHFAQRARLPRLVRAVACDGSAGVGIDEDTALIVDRNNWSAKVIGRGNIVIVNRLKLGDCASGRSLPIALRYYAPGDRIKNVMKVSVK